MQRKEIVVPEEFKDHPDIYKLAYANGFLDGKDEGYVEGYDDGWNNGFISRSILG